MSTDRELLELAAKASGREGDWVDFAGMDIRVGYQGGLLCGDADSGYYWNPLKDDGDLYRLAREVKGNLYFSGRRGFFEITSDSEEPAITEHFEIGNREEEARAIVRAAAEIGRAMP